MNTVCSRIGWQYRSKGDNTFKPCELWEVVRYQKYGYETRVVNLGITEDYLL